MQKYTVIHEKRDLLENITFPLLVAQCAFLRKETDLDFLFEEFPRESVETRGNAKGLKENFGRSNDACDFRIRPDFCALSVTRCAVRESSKSWCLRRKNIFRSSSALTNTVNPWRRLKDGRGHDYRQIYRKRKFSSKPWRFLWFQRIFSGLPREETFRPELSFFVKTNLF